MRNSNTNNWRSTALIAGAILTAGVVTTTSTTDVHADNSQNNAQVSNDQVTYDQVRATADQQLAQLQSANDSKEAQQATANEQSNAADLAQTNAQIDQLKASHAALEQEQAGAIAQAQASTAASIEAQTSAANAEYQQQINTQQQNEATQRAANDQQYAQAVSQAAENQQAVADIDAQYQKALSDAANTQTSQAQAAANDYNSAVAKENDTYQGKLSAQQATNAENIKNAEASLASATANANKPYEVATTNDVAVTGRVAKPQTDVKVPAYVTKYGIHLEVRGYNGAIPVSDYTYPEFANTYYGEYPDSTVITNKAAESTPHDISEMPLNFQPGLLSYDAKNDHSEKVSADGLTADQVQVLRALALSWENGFRNNVFQNYREFYNVVNKNDGFVNVAPVDLVSTDFTDNIANQVVANRTKYNIDNNNHTVISSGMPAEATYTSVINDATKNLKKNLTSEFNGKSVYTDVNENLTTTQAGTPTLLNYAINLYNSMQGMYYGELVNPTHIGGHAVNLLCAGVRTVGIGFQKLTDEMTAKNESGVSDRKNPSYAVTFDHVGFNIDHDANLTKEIQNRNVWGTSTVDAQLNTIKTAQYHVNKVPGTKTVTPTATDVQKATASEQQKLADVKAQAQQSLDALASAHQSSLNKLAQQYKDAKAQVKANYDVAVTKAASVRDAKIANIKKAENVKLDAKINELVPSVDPQIKQLQDQHQAVIAHGDAVLAELKAENKAAYNKLAEQFNVQLAAIQRRENAKRANEVRLANNTVVLPSAVKVANDGNIDTVAFPTASNPLQAETTGRVQTVSAPSIVKTATQTPIAVAPVVTTVNHAAENTVKSNESSAPVVTQTTAVAATTNNGTQTSVASTADNKATKADNSEKSVVKAGTVAKKQTPAKKSESSQKVDQSSMSIVDLAATALLGTLGITYSSKKRHN
ncbi:hypothetical protein [Limosilactobacillus reuteri]|uniref:hypothetical protein n=1 Tax=Limosilactobacillus reuteri TaxID=1598 RepID=UPI001E3DC90B|nr:hypothetical protein [Limosilactobacillus reuteri]MCC4499681.1 hypothetical protein [Limosilactobacillus reuteri]MCC4504017.1 hypothetical protein [Limosilactobacillus reuteri]MCC4506875.1 hypothetical protein [Limosilactobacillus reuteri]